MLACCQIIHWIVDFFLTYLLSHSEYQYLVRVTNHSILVSKQFCDMWCRDTDRRGSGGCPSVPLSHHFLPAIICVNIMNHKQNCLPQENIDIKTCIHPAAALQSSNMYSSSSPNIKQKQRLRWNLLLHETCIVHFTPNQNNYSCYNMLENVFSVWCWNLG